MFITWVNFVMMLVLTGILFRYIETNFPETVPARALMYIY